MSEAQRNGTDGLLDMEKELTCSICTDILYQPLTLLDCLHTFCGSCLKEWFAWQAASTARTPRPNAHPYTCPSCRESVRSTKADWRLTALLEGYLKANPDRTKSDADKKESSEAYKPGDNVIPKVEIKQESDSEDERLMAEVRDLSMANVDPETARRRAERARGQGRERRRQARDTTQQPRLSEERLIQHNANEPHVEHQPSLRSLLSASPIESHDVQQEIMQSIYAEGLLEGIDIDNLTPEQEDQLTERIAEAYRRRQRRRDRSGNRTRAEDVSQSAAAGAEDRARHHSRTASASSQQPRARPPVSRPHLFEQQIPSPSSRQQRSTSGTSQRSNLSTTRVESTTTAAARSATDLSERTRTEESRQERHRRMSSNARSTTDPAGHRTQVHRMRASSGNTRDVQSVVISPSHPLEAMRRQAAPMNNSSPSLPTTSAMESQHTVRPAISTAAFAPEPISNALPVPPAPIVNCNRCGTANIQHDLHYHCPRCRSGAFNMCQACYRDGQGCDHWYGFGFKADERFNANAPQGGWPSEYERPHVLESRRYLKQDSIEVSRRLQEGAFCESCSSFADECYWYCLYCLEGAWGYCGRCVQQGQHCTHPLLPVAQLSTLAEPLADPSRATFVPMPHLRPDSYILWPVTTDCDICRRQIQPSSSRFHCFRCSDGDYDICTDCYYNLVGIGKISQANGPDGWRRCLQGHRMAVVGFQDVQYGGQQRIVVREPVGGQRHKEGVDQASPPGPAEQSQAKYNYFLRSPGEDDLAFPKNADIAEVKEEAADWYSGVYRGKLGLFPSSHVRKV
ncbi:hypothetical protein LTR56_025467 [Elasticomyces elasticus]|nr:hypothetical protein LTR56_025467 [Elasticomyces elasticus]KAK3620688.1 hypothetical protein LTR22_025491 [Elasticomyces elasticus]KAK4924817.1 hypothetical protein LTR49_008038 [Elasticomyces elasticus]KAK5740308.1 hypothetical protein LTS12_025006 [Elasticomyces elasticus]